MKMFRAGLFLALAALGLTTIGKVQADEWVVVAGSRGTSPQFAAAAVAATSNEVGLAGFNGGSDFFPAARGIYNGLIAPEGDVVPERSGYFRVSISSHGSLSGYFVIGGDRVPLRGWFNAQGLAGFSIYRRVWDDCHCFLELMLVWTVELNLVANSDELHGTFVNERRGGWETTLYGLRAGYALSRDTAPQAGRYTLRLPGSVDPAVAPPGDGFGAVSVNARGMVSMSGALPEATKVVDSAYLSVDGYWPMYIPLNDGHGLLFGWLQFYGGELTGDLTWQKPSREDRTFYPEGFGGTINARGGLYTVAPGASSPFTWTQGQLQVSDGNVGGILANEVEFRSPSAITAGGDDLLGFRLKVNARTGLFNGSFLHPISRRKTAYAGALFQFENAGGGYFLGTNQGGTVSLVASPAGR